MLENLSYMVIIKSNTFLSIISCYLTYFMINVMIILYLMEVLNELVLHLMNN